MIIKVPLKKVMLSTLTSLSFFVTECQQTTKQKTVSTEKDTSIQQIIDKSKTFEVSAGNKNPIDINPKAEKLSDEGLKLFNNNSFQEGIQKMKEALKIDPRIPTAIMCSIFSTMQLKIDKLL